MAMGGPIYHIDALRSKECDAEYDDFDSGYLCRGCERAARDAVALLENMNYCFSPDTAPAMHDGSVTDVLHYCGDCDGCNIKAFLGRIGGRGR